MNEDVTLEKQLPLILNGHRSAGDSVLMTLVTYDMLHIYRLVV